MHQPSSHESDQRKLDHDIRGMVSSLNSNLRAIGKKPTRDLKHGEDVSEDAGGGAAPRIVALAGGNKGATMRAAGLDDAADAHGLLFGGGSDGRVGALANSNYQAANNSLMIGGSCTAEDPGVHIVIEGYTDEEDWEVHDEDSEEDEYLAKKDKKNKDKKKDLSDYEEEHKENEEN